MELKSFPRFPLFLFVLSLLHLAAAVPVGPRRTVHHPVGFIEIDQLFLRQSSQNETLLSNETSVSSTVTITLLPEKPMDKHVTEILSLFVFASNFTPEINDACIECFASTTNTSTSLWGVFNVTQPASIILQAEYFVSVPTDISNATFNEAVSELLKEENGTNHLTHCVHEKNVGLPANAKIRAGRTIAAREGTEYTTTDSKLASWISGAIIGGVALLSMIALVVIVKHANANPNSPEDYPSAEIEEQASRTSTSTDADQLAQIA